MTKSLRLFIEQVIQQELAEEAVPYSMAVSQGLAMRVDEEGGVTTMILYDPRLYGTKEMIMGLIEIEKSFTCHSWRIVTSSAEKGYGPLMYDIAFSYAGKDGLMSDRIQVSDAARKVWAYNFTVRKNDFEIVPVEGKCAYKGRWQEEQALNHKFILKNPIDFRQFVDSHEKFMNTLGSKDQDDFLNDLIDQSVKFFNQKYYPKTA